MDKASVAAKSPSIFWRTTERSIGLRRWHRSPEWRRRSVRNVQGAGGRRRTDAHAANSRTRPRLEDCCKSINTKAASLTMYTTHQNPAGCRRTTEPENRPSNGRSTAIAIASDAKGSQPEWPTRRQCPTRDWRWQAMTNASLRKTYPTGIQRQGLRL